CLERRACAVMLSLTTAASHDAAKHLVGCTGYGSHGAAVFLLETSFRNMRGLPSEDQSPGDGIRASSHPSGIAAEPCLRSTDALGFGNVAVAAQSGGTARRRREWRKLELHSHHHDDGSELHLRRNRRTEHAGAHGIQHPGGAPLPAHGVAADATDSVCAAGDTMGGQQAVERTRGGCGYCASLSCLRCSTG